MDIVDEKYLKGFNHAYLLAKNNPELLKQILNTDGLNNYIQGLKDGKEAYVLKKVKSRNLDLNKLQSQKNRNLDLER